uniref:Uncharacterized protein n=1 Tax=Ditylenchus dipsaci TaxID=166011 RepID=A0A915D4U6_9BILA
MGSGPQRNYHHPLASSTSTTYYGEPGILIEEDHLAFHDDLENEDNGSTSSEGGNTYEMSEREEASALFGEDFQLSAPLKEALETVNHALISDNGKENENGGTQEVININATDWAFKYVQHEWLKLSTKKTQMLN